MPYYPKSQIQTGIYTNGGEFILSTTDEIYVGYYYELSNGEKYTGKTPDEKPNILLKDISIPTDNSIDLNNPPSSVYTNNNFAYKKPIISDDVYVPQYNHLYILIQFYP